MISGGQIGLQEMKALISITAFVKQRFQLFIGTFRVNSSAKFYAKDLSHFR
jgi:hypothetical protein